MVGRSEASEIQSVRARKARDWFASSGVTIAKWAADNGYSRRLVNAVLNGRPAIRGTSFEIAVRLGIKDHPAPPPWKSSGEGSPAAASAAAGLRESVSA